MGRLPEASPPGRAAGDMGQLQGDYIYVHRLIREASQLVHPILEIQSLVVHIINYIK